MKEFLQILKKIDFYKKIKMKFNYKNVVFLSALFFLTTGNIQAQNNNPGQGFLRHVVVITFKTGASTEQIKAVDNSFKNLSKLKMVKEYEWGVGSDERDSLHVKHVYVTTFANKDDEEAYGKSPEHQAHIKLGREYIESVSGTDYYLNE